MVLGTLEHLRCYSRKNKLEKPYPRHRQQRRPESAYQDLRHARQGAPNPPSPKQRASQTELDPIEKPRGAHRSLREYRETRDNDQFARDAWNREGGDPGHDGEKPASDEEGPFRASTPRPPPSLIELLKSASRRRALEVAPSLFQRLQHIDNPEALPASPVCNSDLSSPRHISGLTDRSRQQHLSEDTA
jgi:hypothetical protein